MKVDRVCDEEAVGEKDDVKNGDVLDIVENDGEEFVGKKDDIRRITSGEDKIQLMGIIMMML